MKQRLLLFLLLPLSLGASLLQENRPGHSKTYRVESEEGELLGFFRTGEQGEAEARVALFDWQGFFRIPPMQRREIEGKEGYLQQVARVDYLLPPLENLQRIALLDLLIGNADRHDENVLVIEGQLIPIDHELSVLGSLPAPPFPEEPMEETLLPIARVLPIWLDQDRFGRFAELPLLPHVRDYVLSLDPEEIRREIAREVELSSERWQLVEALLLWVQMAAAADLPLQEIAAPLYHHRLPVETTYVVVRQQGPSAAPLLNTLEIDLQMALQGYELRDLYAARIGGDDLAEERLWFILTGKKGKILDDMPEQEQEMVLLLARELLREKLTRDFGSVAAGMQHWIAARELFFLYRWWIAETFDSVREGELTPEEGMDYIRFLAEVPTPRGKLWEQDVLEALYALSPEEREEALQGIDLSDPFMSEKLLRNSPFLLP